MSNKIKRYKLLKDLPFAKAGEIFKGELEYGTTVLFPEDYENYKHKLCSDEFWDFDEWFEEIVEPELVYCIDDFRSNVISIRTNSIPNVIANLKSTGNCFETEEEAKKYLAYLEAKEVIKQDAKGFKPDWENPSQKRFFGYFNLIDKTLCHFDIGENMESKIFFGSREDINESFKKHPKEWKTYLTYEQ